MQAPDPLRGVPTRLHAFMGDGVLLSAVAYRQEGPNLSKEGSIRIFGAVINA